MGMEHTKGMLFRGDIIAQNQIQLIMIATFSSDRSDRVVLLPLCLCKDKGGLITVAAPCIQDHIRQGDQPLCIRTGNSDYGHRPVYNSCLYIFKAFDGKAFSTGAFAIGNSYLPP